MPNVYLPIANKNHRTIPLGTCTHVGYWWDPRHTQALKDHYQILTPEIEGVYTWVYGNYLERPQGWAYMDKLVAFAMANGKQIFYHTLRWSFREQPVDYEAWITEAMKRYPQIRDWCVVNEGWDANGVHTIPGIWESYEIARWVRPNARLWYNGGLTSLVEQEQAKMLIGLGLADGIGIQCHHWLGDSWDCYLPMLTWLKDNHVPWRITELDVCLLDLSDEAREVQLARQADEYATAMQLVREFNGEALSTWGVADCVSWKKDYLPLPRGWEYEPKPAWEVLTR